MERDGDGMERDGTGWKRMGRDRTERDWTAWRGTSCVVEGRDGMEMEDMC